MAIYAAGKRIPVRHFAPALLCVMIAAFAVRTWVRNGDWQDERAMAEASIETSPNSFKVHQRLASTFDANSAAGANLGRAMEEANRALAIVDSLPDSRNTPQLYRLAGGLHLANGDFLRDRDPSASSREYQRALQLLERSIAIDRSTRAEYDRKVGAEWARRQSALPASARGDPEAHWMLAAAYLRLGNAEQAGAAAGEALALHPLKSEAYRQISYAFIAQDRIDDAAVALIEGMLITSDFSLRSGLLDLYRRAPGNSCAITSGPHGPALNLTCDLVHKQFCAASVEAVKAAIEEERWDVARKQKENFVHNYGCPAGPLNQVLPE
jgi:tetratricopeptide (TPR) repeat protein